MSSKRQALIFLLVLTIFFFTIKASSSDGNIAIYWGQHSKDGSLTSTCDTGNYKIVLLAFLNVFGEGRISSWNFAGHCGAWSLCTKLESEIKHCQQKGVKVFLSLGGASGSYSLKGKLGPLGRVTLDGVDFAIIKGSNLYWEYLARHLDNKRHQNRYFYLAAAPQCIMPYHYLDKAIKTGLFDYVLVQFYNNPSCQYNLANGNATLLLKSWNAWTSLALPNNTVYMGLPSRNATPSGGYIPPNDLISKVLPHIKKTPNYGGIVLWDRFNDIENNYSNQIKEHVKRSAFRLVSQVSKAILGSVSEALNVMLPN